MEQQQEHRGKETTIYVGKIPTEITNNQIKSILKTCGNLSEWKRTRDIEAPYRYKPFGFATFESLEGVLAAMRVLDGMQLYENVDEQMKARTETLLLNVNQATKMAAEKFNAERQEKGLGAKDGEEDYERKRKIEKIMKGEMDDAEDDDEDEDEKKKKAKKDDEVVDAGEFSDEEETRSGAKRATTTTTTTTKSSQEKLRTASMLTNQISTNKSTSEGGTKTETTGAKTAGTIQYEDGEVGRANQADNNVPAKPLTKRQREEKRREDEKRRNEQREFGRRERQWLDEERFILNERNKRMRRQRDEKINLEQTRASRRKRDDDDRQLNVWERDERDLDRRKRFRERELEAEEKDRQNEIEEIEEAKRDEEKRLEEERKKKLNLEKAKKEKTVKETTIAGFSKRKKTKTSEDGGDAGVDGNEDDDDDDDDDDADETIKLNKKRRRQFLPIEYTEAEKRIVASGLTVDHKDTDDQDQKRLLEEEKKRKAAIEQSIIDKIPTKKADVFSYDIDWSAFKTSGAESLCRKWVAKKTVELLGEEEDAVVDFVLEKLRERVDASVLLEELSVFLDEEAESFVLKLWRMIIYETLKFKSKLK